MSLVSGIQAVLARVVEEINALRDSYNTLATSVASINTDPTPLIFSFGGVSGVLSVGTGTGRLYAWRALTITGVSIAVGSAPTGSSVIIDVNKNGTTIFTTQANRPTVAISGFSSTKKVPDVTAIAQGDVITIDVDQVGSTLPGNYGQVTIEFV